MGEFKTGRRSTFVWLILVVGVLAGGGTLWALITDFTLVSTLHEGKAEHADQFELNSCQGFNRIRDFSNYELLNKERTVVLAGHKQGLCLGDSFKFEGDKSNDFNCSSQGITSGWAGWYYKKQIGQWIDITGVPEGDYIVRVTVNADGRFDEGQNRYTNSVETSIHVPDPHKRVKSDNSPEVVRQ